MRRSRKYVAPKPVDLMIDQLAASQKRVPYGKMQSLTLEELKAMIGQVADDVERLMILVAFWHGLRATEVVRLEARNIESGHLALQRLKGSLATNQEFIVPQDPELAYADALEALALSAATRGGPRGQLFPMTRFAFYRIVSRAGKAAGLPKQKRHPHCLKHTIANATIHSAGIENVRQWLGHKSISSTGEYLKVSDQKARTAIAGAMAGK